MRIEKSVLAKMRVACHLLEPTAATEMTKLLDFVDTLSRELEHRKREVSVLRYAVVYGRQELNIPETQKEKECAAILDRGRSESTRIVEEMFLGEKL